MRGASPLAIDDVMKIIRILDIRRSHIVSCCYVLGEVYACSAMGEPQRQQRGNRATSMTTAGKTSTPVVASSFTAQAMRG